MLCSMLCVNVFRIGSVCVCVWGGKENREEKKKKKKSVRAVNTSKVTSFGWASLHGSAQLELLRDQSPQRHPHLWECVCMWEWIHMFILMCPMYMCHMHVCGGGFLLNLYGSEWIPVQAWLSVLIRCSALGEVRWWGEGLQWAEAPRVLVIS